MSHESPPPPPTPPGDEDQPLPPNQVRASTPAAGHPRYDPTRPMSQAGPPPIPRPEDPEDPRTWPKPFKRSGKRQWLCWESGGRSVDGSPCLRPVRKRGLLCPNHDPTRAALLLRKKRRNQKAFLEVIAQTANISAAARQTGINRKRHEVWMNTDPEYRERFLRAIETASDILEAEARRRAVIGTDKPVYHQGRKIDTIKEYSDTLLIFLLKAARPEKYRERYEANITADQPIPVAIYIPNNGRDPGMAPARPPVAIPPRTGGNDSAEP